MYYEYNTSHKTQTKNNLYGSVQLKGLSDLFSHASSAPFLFHIIIHSALSIIHKRTSAC